MQQREQAIAQAKHFLMNSRSNMALYFANNKLCKSEEYDTMYERRLEIHKDNLVGVYKKGCSFIDVEEDINDYYETKVNLDIPCFLKEQVDIFGK